METVELFGVHVTYIGIVKINTPYMKGHVLRFLMQAKHEYYPLVPLIAERYYEFDLKWVETSKNLEDDLKKVLKPIAEELIERLKIKTELFSVSGYAR